MSRSLPEADLRKEIRRLQSGDHTPLPGLLETYRPLLERLTAPYFLPSGDRDDLLQEATIAFYRAALTYDVDRSPAFTTYASTVVKNHLLDCIKSANAQKQQPLNSSTSIDEQFFSLETRRADTLDVILAGELAKEVADRVSTVCSPLEQSVLIRYLQHEQVAEIADHLGISSKTVENALYRARKKLRGLFTGE